MVPFWVAAMGSFEYVVMMLNSNTVQIDGDSASGRSYVTEHLNDRTLAEFMQDLSADGLLVAPGPAFGPYPNHIRLCFTSATPDVVARGVEILARHMGR